MLVKFFSRGTGGGKGPVEYLSEEKDAYGVKREPAPELIKGNPLQTIQLIDSLDFKHKYCSGVISFAPEDAPSEEQQQELIDSFEQIAFADLEADQYSILWVRHNHTNHNRVELHFVTPRVELSTGKSLNIAPPGWENYYRPWQDYWNYSQDWARPDDPKRARTYHRGYQALIDAQNERLELNGNKPQTREDVRKIITNYLGEKIKLGQIKDRNDIVKALEDSGFTITRQGEEYLTVDHEDIGKRTRLKGGIYSASWGLREKLTTEVRTGTEANRKLTEQRIEEAKAELRERVSKRAEYYQSRYGASQTTNSKSIEVVSNAARSSTYEHLDCFLNRQLGDESILKQTSSTNSNPETNLRTVEEPKLGSRTASNDKREISDLTPQYQVQDRLALPKPTLFKTTLNEDEPIRTRTNTDFFELQQTVLEGQESRRRTNENLNHTNTVLNQCHQQLIEQIGRIRRLLSKGDEELEQLEMNRIEELEQFKSQINLVEYVQNQGYEIDLNKSSQNCFVVKNNRGDKLLIGIDQKDHHYFYYSLRDETDSGSIIDFIQKRQNLNLGQVRKELRPWLNQSSTYTNNSSIPKPKPTSKDRQKIIIQFENLEEISYHPYLKRRGISPDITNNPRFQNTIYGDSRNNVIFPHFDREGVCGYSIRNQDFKGFSRGGSKGLWFSKAFPGDKKLVICESPLDCLSYHQLHPDSKTRYFATGGTLSEKQKDLLTTGIERIHAKGGVIILATDRDKAGNELALELTKIAPKNAQVYRHVPKHQKDWNEALKAQIQQEIQRSSHSQGLEL